MDIVSPILQQGLLGIIVVVLGWQYQKKDQQLQAEAKQHLLDVIQMTENSQKSAEAMAAAIATSIEKENEIAQASNQIAQGTNQIAQMSYQILQNLQNGSNIRKQ